MMRTPTSSLEAVIPTHTILRMNSQNPSTKIIDSEVVCMEMHIAMTSWGIDRQQKISDAVSELLVLVLLSSSRERKYGDIV
jgi:hypothetical protein